MSEHNKARLAIVAIVIALIFLWFWLRRNPAIAQAVQDAATDLGLPDLELMPYLPPGTSNYGDVFGSYVPATMPGLQGARGYSPCNFCLQSVTKVTTPSPALIIPVAPTPAQVKSYPPPYPSVRFGGHPSPPRPPLAMPWGGTY